MIPELLGSEVKIWDLMGNTELPYHPTMDIHDASKIQCFMDSPRKYFYQYILGWRIDSPNIHLVFGSAWHKAMEHLLLSLNGDDPYGVRVVGEAYDLFMETYREAFPNEYMDQQHGAKEPANALKALAGYSGLWAEDIRRLQPLYTEVAGAVPVSDTRTLHFKLDSIVAQDGDAVLSMEHKTTGRLSQAWRDSWDVKFQPWLYTHALHTLFQDSNVRGVVINGAVLRKKSNEFLRLPIAKSNEMMREGLWKANHWLDQLEWNWQNLLNTSVHDDVMPAFPCNGESCSKFGCSFSAFCTTWPNALKHAHTPPPGYVQEFWDPRREEKDAKYLATDGHITKVDGTSGTANGN